ncbi:hypothetical protein BJF79_13970 [Actinomadura sp. CNU-125]|uniref:DUF262 domain-containing protein n=1 Tax=Actinomadura sp. CNU-125 TaxID=1904961 RepID=UPI000969F3B8|nr:DUF262 domain-containing protein [Actinomadura sp. CNU-125]OLT24060.1 hypothetical protein BJF79_13970 [Actinomadura sp. CNU-125]
MGFLPAITVEDALAKVHKKSWVLPAIQREFVWSTNQIRTLFDSLMRGYPMGSFLLWGLEKEHVGDFTFYDFLTDYHEFNRPYAPKASIPAGHDAIAVLDGQQRLTALNIGLYGSHAERLPRRWVGNPDAYPTKRLYLNLLREPEGENELGLQYNLQFLTDEEAKAEIDGVRAWFRVGDVLSLSGGSGIMQELKARGVSDASGWPEVYDRLDQLVEGVRKKPAINAYQEDSQDPERVLDIFVRVNSGGTKLSNSDLLLSMATNQWEERDAREEIRSLVADLADGPGKFQFSKDLVLKTALVLTEAPDFQFKISNFTKANMSRLEKGWTEIRASLLRAAELLASFGLNGRNLSADSVVIPVAYYLHTHGHGDGYVKAGAHAADRAAVRRWVFRSLLKRGVWGSGLDTLLRHIQTVIRDSPDSGFPIGAVESAMASRGKALTFSAEEVEELLELQYRKPRTFPVLAILYPGLNLDQQIHEDHIFPKSRFTPSALTKAGVPADEVEEYRSRVNGLPNLQLLAGVPNVEKSNRWPWEWLDGDHFPSAEAREQYATQNDLDLLPDGITGFVDFYEHRKKRLAQRLAQLINSDHMLAADSGS